jgi:hypothetical protein
MRTDGKTSVVKRFGKGCECGNESLGSVNRGEFLD